MGNLFHRSSDCEIIANYRVQAELSAIDSTYDGRSIVLGTVDGCVSVLAIADPKKPEMTEYLANVPSRDEEVRDKYILKRHWYNKLSLLHQNVLSNITVFIQDCYFWHLWSFEVNFRTLKLQTFEDSLNFKDKSINPSLK